MVNTWYQGMLQQEKHTLGTIVAVRPIRHGRMLTLVPHHDSGTAPASHLLRDQTLQTRRQKMNQDLPRRVKGRYYSSGTNTRAHVAYDPGHHGMGSHLPAPP